MLSIDFFLLPVGSIVKAMLKRSMQCGISYQINLAKQVTQSSVTVLPTYLGWMVGIKIPRHALVEELDGLPIKLTQKDSRDAR